jgi:tetratricopeptide (TPR) repeat protein
MTTRIDNGQEAHSNGMDMVEPLVQAFLRQFEKLGPALAQVNLLDSLVAAPTHVVVACARRLLGIGAASVAAAVLRDGSTRQETPELLYWSAFALRETGDWPQAELDLRKLLSVEEGNAPATFLLALVLYEQGRYRASSELMRAFCKGYPPADAESLITVSTAFERSDDAAGAFEVAAQACETAADPALHMEAGRLALKLGQFDRARDHLEKALESGDASLHANALHALASAQRYASADHPDFQRITEWLSGRALSPAARASALSAAGKAHDDIGDFQRAAEYFAEANHLLREQTVWSGDAFANAAFSRPPIKQALPAATTDFVPVFVVGMPRTGTTLLADLLARHPQVHNRGELTWMEYLAARLADDGTFDPSSLSKAADIYRRHLRRDDDPVRWYIDKQPFNFYHLDLIAAMFPNAKVLHCRRNPRDTALSIWMQHFAGDAAAFSCDFDRIADVMQAEQSLMQRWRETLPIAIHDVSYEALVARPDAVLGDVAAFLEMEPFDFVAAAPKSDQAIGTSSMWQARQPIYSRAIGHWRNYSDRLPELASHFPDVETN